jgi:glycosyltransferase involved in cell wall biosynthesis
VTQSPPRLLCVHQNWGLYGSDRVFLQTVHALRARFPEGHLTVLLPGDGPLREHLSRVADEVRLQKLLVLRRSELRRGRIGPLLAAPRLIRSARRLIDAHDLTYVNTVALLDFVLGARQAEKPAVVHLHEAPTGLERSVLRGLLALSGTPLICNSRATADSLASTSPRAVLVVPNGTPRPRQAPPEPGRDLPGRPLNLLMLGRLVPRKGHLVLLEALGRLGAAWGHVRTRIVGDAFDDRLGYRQQLAGAIGQLGLADYVSLEPFVADPSPLYAWADVVVVPSLAPESFGLVAIEAMAHGRPVIAADAGGLAEVVVPGVTGALVVPGDADGFARRIWAYLENPSLLARHGAAGHERFEKHFDESIYLERIGEIAASLLERSAGTRLGQ